MSPLYPLYTDTREKGLSEEKIRQGRKIRGFGEYPSRSDFLVHHGISPYTDVETGHALSLHRSRHHRLCKDLRLSVPAAFRIAEEGIRRTDPPRCVLC